MKLHITDEHLAKQSEFLVQFLNPVIDFELSITPQQSSDSVLTVCRQQNHATITYQKEVHFYRGLGLLLTHLEDENYTCQETIYTEHLGAMFDCSRNAVLRPEKVKEYIRILALLGYNDLLLYTEETYEIKEQPYFGYMRGRYTINELKDLDSYAQSFGISMIPCIQTLAHLRTYLRWPVTAEYKDNDDILLVGEEKTYELIENMLKNLRSCFSGNRIHIGMDEAFLLGLGNYLKKHGYQNRTGIMKQHLDRVLNLCQKYDFSPMMWSDMYFSLASEDGDYYHVDQRYEWNEQDKPSPEVSMVYWDYYSHSTDIYQKMVTLHRKLTPNMYFAGGGWTWNGLAPNYSRAFDTTEKGLSVMKQLQVKNWFCTFWQDNGAETPIETGLLPMTHFAELAYHSQITKEQLNCRFKQLFGSDALYLPLLDEFDNHSKDDPLNTRSGNPSKWALYQDPLLGIFDKQLYQKSLTEVYTRLAVQFAEASEQNGRFGLLYKYYSTLAELLSIKTELGMKLYCAYQKNDIKTLESLSSHDLTLCVSLTEKLRLFRQELWMDSCKPQGYESIDIRLGGLLARLSSAKQRISRYVNGQLDSLEELEEDRLAFDPAQSEFFCSNLWEKIVSAGNIFGV